MKNDKILSEILCIQKALNDEDIFFAKQICDELITNISNEINSQIAKNFNKKQAQSAAMHILKNAPETHPHLSKSIISPDGFQFICDGYRMIKLHEHLPLPENTETKLIERANDFVPFAEKLLNAAILDCYSNGIKIDISTVKNFISIEKAKANANHFRLKNAPFEIIDGCWCDAVLLVDMLDILDDPIIHFSSTKVDEKAIYFEAKNGSGILLPIRKPKTKENE